MKGFKNLFEFGNTQRSISLTNTTIMLQRRAMTTTHYAKWPMTLINRWEKHD